jgi:hypothetical protein
MAIFSIRHRRALSEGTLEVILAERLRNRLSRQVASFDQEFEHGFREYATTSSDILDELHDAYGEPASASLTSAEAIVVTASGEVVLDILEVFAEHHTVVEDQFAGALNEVFQQEESGWRMLGGEMVMLDTFFMRDAVARQADESLSAVGIAGALRELRDAHNDVVDGDHRAAVHSAGKAYESVMMAMLQRTNGSAKGLAQEIRRAGYLDGLPPQLREPFASGAMQALPWMRNKLGGHGQGHEEVPLPRAYPELAVSLAAAFAHFLVTLEVERNPTRDRNANPRAGGFREPAPVPADDDIPF